MAASEEFIPVGKIAGTFGVKGWMKVISFTDPRKNLLSYKPLYLSSKGSWREIKVLNGRVQGKGIVISLENINDPDQVLPLVGSELAITKQQLKPLADDEFYWSQLTGLEVVNLKGEPLGRVDKMLETGANDVLVVTKEQNEQQLIPFVMEEVVHQVDLDNGVIKVDWEQDY